ncbi:NAD(P)-binding protein [Tothia fuscella]|uniref:NAD(P)-binding protein n=1 Tax=Tothia fuscella TaxID=1048955 RepID=A0A9P4U3A1_9PEZI|nr:NAD(P)-binding protein [Tothia fuscella]
MSLPTKTRAWVLANKPKDHAILSGPDATFKLETQELPPLQDGQLLVQIQYLSNDPAQRGWIDADIQANRLYVAPVEVGETMRARGVCKILSSKDSNFKEGDLVLGPGNWREYAVVNTKECQPVMDIPGVSPTQFLGALGGTGLTAYVGLVENVGVKKGESLVVSGAAGATGSMVVQIAKHIVGCSKVIGLAGTDEKCRWVESLGADKCINYKSPDWKDQLTRATDPFVDIYFDNVGGETLDLMLTRLKTHGRVSSCGAISDYNKGEKYGLKNYFEVIMQRLQIKGFIVMDYLTEGRGAKFTKILADATREGKLKVGEENETVVDTKFEDVPKTWVKLFEGGNQGKLVTHIV